MSQNSRTSRRLSPATRTALGVFARYGTILGLAAMIIAFSILSPRAFPSVNNFTNVINQASLAMIIAGGLTMAVIVGELDLSIGFAASLHGLLATGLIVSNKLPIPLAIIIVIALGALIGLVNGFIVTRMKVNSVIATLGVGTILTGLAFAYTSGVPIVSGVPEAFLQLSLGRWLFGIPNNIIVMIIVLGTLWALVERTSIGQEIQAVGGNPAAARLAGIDVAKVKTLGFVISGMCAAMTGILLASRLGSGTTSAADSYLLTAFAAVFLGSATLRDGEFHIFGTFVGALIIAFGFNGLNIFGAPTFSQYIFQGAILIVAVGLSSLGASDRKKLAKGKFMSADNANWEIYVLEYARAKDQPIAALVNGTHDEGLMDTPFAFVFARNGTHNILVDTGFMREGSGAEMSERFGVPDWISPLELLAELDVKPDDITDIFLSHAHFDHAGSVHKFPNARIVIQKSELLSWHEAMALPPQFGFLTDIINPDDLRNIFDASVEHRVHLLDGDKDNVLPGVHARFGPGHTIGQQFIILESARGNIVVSGDCVYSSTNIAGHNHNGVYVPLNNAIGSVWDQLKTIDRINDVIEGDLSRLIIMHDIDRWDHLPLVKELNGFKISRAH